MFYAVKTNKLTVPGSLVGGILALFIFAGTGLTGIFMLAAFFILGSAATSWKASLKNNLNLRETNKGKRTVIQVLANAGVAGAIGLLIILLPDKLLFLKPMLAASLSSAAADTLSSELGNVYGRNFYNIVTLKKDKRGLDGVVSLEGFVFGILGSSIIAIAYFLFEGFDRTFIWIIISGSVGNLVDSVLGATLQRKHFLTNNSVNCLNTFIAALFMLIILALIYA